VCLIRFGLLDNIYSFMTMRLGYKGNFILDVDAFQIFGENQDHIAVCRSDGSSSVVFREANWETLRKVEEGCRIQKESNSDGGKKKTFSFVRDIVEYMDVQFQ